MDEHLAAGHRPEVIEPVDHTQRPYEPPLLTPLGSFRALTAGEDDSGHDDDSNRMYPL
jgi:hypothetical protein